MYPRGEGGGGGGWVGVVVVVVIIAHNSDSFFLFELSREEEEEEEEEKRRMLVKIEYTNSRRRDPLYTVKSFSRDRRPPPPIPLYTYSCINLYSPLHFSSCQFR
jgi:hypothetical protein